MSNIALGIALGVPGLRAGGASPATPPVISINHETGDLSQWTAAVTDSGDLSVTAGAALAGTSYGMSVLIDGTGAIYAYKSLAAANTTGIVRYRFYLDPNSIAMANGDNFNIVMLTDINSNPISFVILQKTGANYELYAVCPIDPTGTHLNTQALVITDAPHLVEVETKRATTAVSVDGYTKFWVDGVLAYQTVAADNYDWFNDWQLAIMGANSGVDAGTLGTIYMDELVINDTGALIGPA